ncbi:small terminase subunit [Lactobacillus jensenii]|uniref:DNA-packaging protein n=1 Tax=Lactobacillus mulieris TaxID=2508708 RepID=A0AAP3GYA7_9LACO|nr:MULTISPECIES: small terminase subunit [Lactobacillus]MCW8089999.1 DNA-packaging protein [Lactobacillus jensenii]MCZ3845175.1 DNA-packaging protein [Lactobacillus mulieris]MCZ3900385.1 DNA-packaging protein [Lactobacillus mulieris]MDK6563814.1 small terminase subunit [Lactobacillus mulieris]MDK8082845.1 small terminase subunit [Lactobacillus mulieris]
MAKAQYKKWLEPENLVLLTGWKRNGLTDEQIAHNIGVSRKTLFIWAKQHAPIGNALKKGREVTRLEVENKLFERAMSGNLTAIIFWLKNNWRDKYNDSQLSFEERELAKARIKKLLADTRISEAKAKIAERVSDSKSEQLEALLDKVMEEAQDGTRKSDDKEADTSPEELSE